MAKHMITSIVENGLCTGCGTCISLCPKKAIQIQKNNEKGIYEPEINENKCINCELCLKVCPGHEVNFKDLNLEIFGTDAEDILVGNYLNFYTGHSTDYEIRYNSSSGGLVTQLLIFALEEGLIDGALVTRMREDNPLEPEPFIARTKEEIIEASKSKYCPVPVNIALREILELDEGERVAVVGLPCHIQGIRKAEKVNKKLSKKIVLHLGIFCSINRNFLAQEYLLKKLNINKEDILKFDYRGKGWMGNMTIILKNGDEKSYPYRTYWREILDSYFIPMRCTLCSDQFCELSDISFGDIWLPEYRSDQIGTSVVISRTEIGNDTLDQMKSANKIDLYEIEREKVVKSQINALKLKKNYSNAHISLRKVLRKKVPNYNQKLLKPNSNSYLHVILYYPRNYLSSRRYLWVLLEPFTKLVSLFRN